MKVSGGKSFFENIQCFYFYFFKYSWKKFKKEHEEENIGTKRISFVLKLVLQGSPLIFQHLLFHDWLNVVGFSQHDMYRVRGCCFSAE